MNAFYAEESILKLGYDSSCSTATKAKSTAHEADVRILLWGDILRNDFPGRLCMTSDPRYVRVNFVKSIDIGKWNVWGGSKESILYGIANGDRKQSADSP